MIRNILLILFSSIIGVFAHGQESYDHARLRAENPEIVSRFEFLKTLKLDRPVTIAVLGDFPHTEDFKEILAINEQEIPDNQIDDDGNGYVDDHLGMDMHVVHGRTKGPVISGHENAIISLLDFLIRDNGLVGKIKILPVNITSHKLQFDELYMKKVADGIDYARLRGAEVITMSFGVSLDSRPFFSFINKDYDQSLAYLDSALFRAYAQGILLVGSTSNNPDRDHALEPQAPSQSPYVISVGNVNYAAQMQSSYGKNVDLAFYGTGLYVWGGHAEGYKRVKGASYSTPLVAFSLAIAKSIKTDIHFEDRLAMRNACERKITTKKSVSSGCVFSPKVFLESL